MKKLRENVKEKLISELSDNDKEESFRDMLNFSSKDYSISINKKLLRAMKPPKINSFGEIFGNNK